MTAMLNTESLRQISPKDLEALGLGQVAYLRPALVDGHQVWAVFAANGQQVAVMPSRAAAWAALRENDLELAVLN